MNPILNHPQHLVGKLTSNIPRLSDVTIIHSTHILQSSCQEYDLGDPQVQQSTLQVIVPKDLPDDDSSSSSKQQGKAKKGKQLLFKFGGM